MEFGEPNASQASYSSAVPRRKTCPFTMELPPTTQPIPTENFLPFSSGHGCDVMLNMRLGFMPTCVSVQEPRWVSIRPRIVICHFVLCVVGSHHNTHIQGLIHCLSTVSVFHLWKCCPGRRHSVSFSLPLHTFAILRQSVANRQSRSSSSNDDIVVLGGHFFPPSQDIGFVKGSWDPRTRHQLRSRCQQQSSRFKWSHDAKSTDSLVSFHQINHTQEIRGKRKVSPPTKVPGLLRDTG